MLAQLAADMSMINAALLSLGEDVDMQVSLSLSLSLSFSHSLTLSLFLSLSLSLSLSLWHSLAPSLPLFLPPPMYLIIMRKSMENMIDNQLCTG